MRKTRLLILAESLNDRAEGHNDAMLHVSRRWMVFRHAAVSLACSSVAWLIASSAMLLGLRAVK